MFIPQISKIVNSFHCHSLSLLFGFHVSRMFRFVRSIFVKRRANKGIRHFVRSLFPDCRRIFNTAFIVKRFLLGRSSRPPSLCRIIAIFLPPPPATLFSPPPSSRIRANISVLFANNHIEHSFISHPFDSIVIAVFLSLFDQPNAISAANTNTLSVAQFTM